MKRLTAALIGNPNTGKTTLFNALSGLRQHVGNYPGVTVETKKGQMSWAGRTFDLIDLPGTYSLAPHSPDEMVAVDVILGQQKGETRPDVVVALVDASNLERNLYLTTQALELGVPVVVALNMIDVAEGQGIRIDSDRLSRQLGVPVVPIQANKKKGLDRLRQAILSIADCGLRMADSKINPQSEVPFPEAFGREVQALHAILTPGCGSEGGTALPDPQSAIRNPQSEVPVYLVRRLLLDVGGYTERRLVGRLGEGIRARVQEARARLAAAGCPLPAVEARARYGWIREVIAGCVQRPAQRPVTWTDRLDRVLTHKVWGTLVFGALMFVVFQAIFTWSRPLMKAIGDGKDLLAEFLRDRLPVGPASNLLVDGVLEGVGSVVVFLPQIVILFAFLAVLEDCGYMARAAFLMDKLMARCGLSGKSFIPLLSSVACAVPGIMATRVIEDRRDRLATILVAPLMSCSARLPVYILLIGAFLTAGFPWWLPGLVMFLMYALGLVSAPLVALALKRTLLRGATPAFVLEMPLYKLPSLGTVLGRMADSARAFLRRAGTLILASMVLVWALLYFPRTAPDGTRYDVEVARLQKELDSLRAEAEKDGAAESSKKAVEAKETERNALCGQWKRQSWLGRLGRGLEPAVRPLGWDWKIGMAALASFPAREVVVGTLGIIYNTGKDDTEKLIRANKLSGAMQAATWEDDPGRKVFTIPTALSLMVFFALCCQCASTLAVIRRETRSWRWPLFTFTYMTVLAYLGALAVYQVGRLF